jgi:hypothetical protein
MGYYDKVDYYVAVIISDEDEDDTVEDNFADAEMVYRYWCEMHPQARVYIQQMDTGRITDERLAATL